MSSRVRQRIGFLGGTFDPPHRGHLRLAQSALEHLGLEKVLLAPAGVQPLKGAEAPGASWEQRLRMVELAVQNLPGVPHESKQEPTSLRKERGVSVGLEASPIDAPRSDGQPNYSVDTLGRLREQYPEAEIYFLLGADAFALLRKWRDVEGLLAQCELAVASRPGFELPLDGNDLLEWMPVGTRFLGLEEVRVRDQGPGTRHQQAEPEAAGSTVEARVFLAGSALVRLFLLDDLAEDIAATELRALLARGEGYDWLPGGAEGAVAQYIREHRLYGLNPPAA